jgi:glycosyltransferase involved in cell wall biosynthesis
MKKTPLVSVGIPVYNGEEGIENSINSIIDQNYENIEIIISDNGSTDKTPEICRRFSKKYENIKYYRSETNKGLIWNYNRVFKMSSGEYFMWAADDDTRGKSYIFNCVLTLNKNKNAALCSPDTKVFISQDDDVLYTSSIEFFSEKIKLINRYKEVLNNFPMTAFYGLYRSSKIRKTQLLQEGVIAADVCFIRELSLYGTFIHTADVFFEYRARKKWNNIEQDYYVFTGKTKKPWWYIPFFAVFFISLRDVILSDCSVIDKFKLVVLLIYCEIKRIAVRLFLKLIGFILSDNMKRSITPIFYKIFFKRNGIVVNNNKKYIDRIITPEIRWRYNTYE